MRQELSVQNVSLTLLRGPDDCDPAAAPAQPGHVLGHGAADHPRPHHHHVVAGTHHYHSLVSLVFSKLTSMYRVFV